MLKSLSRFENYCFLTPGKILEFHLSVWRGRYAHHLTPAPPHPQRLPRGNVSGGRCSSIHPEQIPASGDLIHAASHLLHRASHIPDTNSPLQSSKSDRNAILGKLACRARLGCLETHSIRRKAQILEK
jgi:hypothetical protein